MNQAPFLVVTRGCGLLTNPDPRLFRDVPGANLD